MLEMSTLTGAILVALVKINFKIKLITLREQKLQDYLVTMMILLTAYSKQEKKSMK